jgi:hypothetical protein
LQSATILSIVTVSSAMAPCYGGGAWQCSEPLLYFGVDANL